MELICFWLIGNYNNSKLVSSMNPYSQNQYMYPQSGYQYGHQGSQQYQQPQFNIQAMYSNVQPYNNQEFLLTTFGNNIDYIKVFLTLSHEDKLMLYMLT